MSANVALDLTHLNRVARAHNVLLKRDMPFIVNKLGRDVGLRSIPKTKKADPAAIEAYMTRATGKTWQTKDGDRLPLLIMHMLALRRLRSMGVTNKQITAKKLHTLAVKIKSRAKSAASFLRIGWHFNAAFMNSAAGPYSQTLKLPKGKNTRGRRRTRPPLNKLLAAPRRANPGIRTRSVIENLAPSAKRIKPSPTINIYVGYGTSGAQRGINTVVRVDAAFIRRRLGLRSSVVTRRNGGRP